VIARAPGKVLLLGEYAVLEGAPAVVAAVDRHAVAGEAGARADPPSPFLAAARAEVEARHGPGSEEASRAARVAVDSAALASGGAKLGLGSSAAVTVAAVAWALGPRADLRDEVHRLAHRAHARAQEPRGARGSGADVAASVHGGILEVRRPSSPDGLAPLAVRRLTLPPLALLLVWTGQPADTPVLVAAVRAHRVRDPRGHAAALDAIAAAAAALILARDSPAAIAALAASHGGTAKPTGAGGGDLLLCALPDAASADAFAAAVPALGLTVLRPRLGAEGVTLSPSPQDTA
jgi:phosphomevalonate kinase